MAGRFEIVDRGGKLAIRTFDYVYPDRPAVREDYYVSSARAEDYSGLLGKMPVDSGRNWVYGQVRTDTGHYIYITPYNAAGELAEGWSVQSDERPIPKPRDGRQYTWVYERGEWRKQDYPRCAQCRHYHRPDWPYHEECDLCHPANITCDQAWERAKRYR